MDSIVEQPEAGRINYPDVRRDESVVKTVKDFEIKDPYRWMEDPASPELSEYISQENEIFYKFIENCTDREYIRKRLTELSDHEKYSNACKKGDRYYFFMNSIKQHGHEQDCLYVQNSLEEDARIFIDPCTLCGDVCPGQQQIGIYSFSTNGELLAYGVSPKNDGWITIRFKSAATGEDFPDVLNRVKETDIAWLADSKGILYTCYPKGSEEMGEGVEKVQSQSLYYHALGTDQDQDINVADFSDYPICMVQAQISDCGAYVIATVTQDPVSILFYGDLNNVMQGNISTPTGLHLLMKDEAYFEYITNTGTTFYLRTNKGAKNYKIITVNLEQLAETSWQTLIGEHPRNVLDWADCVNNDYLLVCYIRDVKHSLQLRRLEDGVLIYVFPLGIGTVTDHFGERSCSEYFFTFTSFLIPDKIYRVDLSKLATTGKCDTCIRKVFGSCLPKPLRLRVFKEVELIDFNPSEFVAKQIFFGSKDGTQIPLFIVHKKRFKLNGKSPCLLYGYGGFGGFVVPSFSISRIPFLKNFEGVFALACIRGGGEYGQSWYNAGRLWGKQCSVDDLTSAAEYLIKAKYTSSANLVVEGRRNGGLVAATCVNQSPQLFGGAIINEGVLDLLRFNQTDPGKAWTSDYGDPENPEDADWQLSLSPLHNVKADKKSQYPAVLVLTSKEHKEVSPFHSYKYTATLQKEIGSNPDQKNPLMLRVDMTYQPDALSPITVPNLIEMRADIYSFLIQALEFPVRNI